MIDNYPFSIIVQFRTTTTLFGLGQELSEIEWRNVTQAKISHSLAKAGLGGGEDGQMNGSALEMFFDVSDRDAAAQVVKQALTDLELIDRCKIVSALWDANEERLTEYQLHHPEDASFELRKWIP